MRIYTTALPGHPCHHADAARDRIVDEKRAREASTPAAPDESPVNPGTASTPASLPIHKMVLLQPSRVAATPRCRARSQCIVVYCRPCSEGSPGRKLVTCQCAVQVTRAPGRSS